MLPVVVAGGRAIAARAGLPALMAGARTLTARVLGSSATAGAAVATRTGIRGGATAVVNAMKNNKVMTALVLTELGTEGYDILSQMAAEDKEIAEMVERYGFTNDPVPDGGVGDLASMADEMECITNAANAIGGLKNLHILRRALGLSESHFKYYDQLKVMASVVG